MRPPTGEVWHRGKRLMDDPIDRLGAHRPPSGGDQKGLRRAELVRSYLPPAVYRLCQACPKGDNTLLATLTQHLELAKASIHIPI